MVDIRITTKNLHLPKNTSAILRRKDKKDYIELDYPQRPYIETLKHGDVIEGHLGVNFENFLQNQAENGGLDEIKNNVNQTIISAGDTFEALTMLLEVVTDILNDAKPEIQESVQNLNKTSKNLADTSFEFKKTIQKGYLDKTLYNIEETSSNLVLTTKNTNSFTTSLDKESGFLINCLLKNLNVLVNNINHIVIGIGNTLSKKFLDESLL